MVGLATLKHELEFAHMREALSFLVNNGEVRLLKLEMGFCMLAQHETGSMNPV